MGGVIGFLERLLGIVEKEVPLVAPLVAALFPGMTLPTIATVILSSIPELCHQAELLALPGAKKAEVVRTMAGAMVQAAGMDKEVEERLIAAIPVAIEMTVAAGKAYEAGASTAKS